MKIAPAFTCVQSCSIYNIHLRFVLEDYQTSLQFEERLSVVWQPEQLVTLCLIQANYLYIIKCTIGGHRLSLSQPAHIT